jgi:acyl-CoA synthetase (AMP-forming)/AMP-acid ligase II
MTETAGIYAISDRTDTVAMRATGQGKPCPGVEIRIIDVETGADLGPGEVGEILVRGHCVMDGYYQDPDKTTEARRRPLAAHRRPLQLDARRPNRLPRPPQGHAQDRR